MLVSLAGTLLSSSKWVLAWVVTLFTDWWLLTCRVELIVAFFFVSVSVCDFWSTLSF